jgi:hypothetical protein
VPTRALAILSSVPLVVQLVFHIYQEWAIFGGRYAFVDRLASTTTPLATVIALVLFVLPMSAWIVLLARAIAARAPIPGQSRAGDPPIARALGGVIRVVSPLAAIGLVVHVVMLWGGRIANDQAPLWTYDLLRTTFGQPLWLGFNGLFVVATTWHLSATLPDGLEALGVVGAEGRRSSFVVTAVLGACLFVLYAQLTGWLATGLGTFWPIEVVDPVSP